MPQSWVTLTHTSSRTVLSTKAWWVRITERHSTPPERWMCQQLNILRGELLGYARVWPALITWLPSCVCVCVCVKRASWSERAATETHTKRSHVKNEGNPEAPTRTPDSNSPLKEGQGSRGPSPHSARTATPAGWSRRTTMSYQPGSIKALGVCVCCSFSVCVCVCVLEKSEVLTALVDVSGDLDSRVGVVDLIFEVGIIREV